MEQARAYLADQRAAHQANKANKDREKEQEDKAREESNGEHQQRTSAGGAARMEVELSEAKRKLEELEEQASEYQQFATKIATLSPEEQAKLLQTEEAPWKKAKGV